MQIPQIYSLYLRLSVGISVLPTKIPVQQVFDPHILHRKDSLRPSTFEYLTPHSALWHDRYGDIQSEVIGQLRAERGQLMIPPLSSHKRHVRSALACSRRCGGLRTDHRHCHIWQNLKETNLDYSCPFLALFHECFPRVVFCDRSLGNKRTAHSCALKPSVPPSAARVPCKNTTSVDQSRK
jgi:hypothetical protein